ncbi:hypothetical protein [Mycobacterium sp.]|uniref:hypothetical protein n=1 Tax=Mycobacterium sp. TaxID=1785 RepID=UPI003BAB9D71
MTIYTSDETRPHVLRNLLRDNVQKAYKAFVVVGFMQFYAVSVFFGVEAIKGFVDIRPDVFSYFKFFVLNGMWMVVPAIAAYLFTQLLKDPEYSAADTWARLRGKPGLITTRPSAGDVGGDRRPD